MQLTNPFPFTTAPLIHCLSNEITSEILANALLAIGAKPIMADDPREVEAILSQSQALLLNLGHLSPEKEKSIRIAGLASNKLQKPFVLDLVGITASPIRDQLGKDLTQLSPTIIKGNRSEMRHFCHLPHHGKGVDASQADQSNHDLVLALRDKARQLPYTCFIATGKEDLIVYQDQVILLTNGTALLDQFTGTGDLVGALATGFLGVGRSALEASLLAVSYLNLCGEKAEKNSTGLAEFRLQTLNHLSLLRQDKNWTDTILGGYYAD